MTTSKIKNLTAKQHWYIHYKQPYQTGVNNRYCVAFLTNESLQKDSERKNGIKMNDHSLLYRMFAFRNLKIANTT